MPRRAIGEQTSGPGRRDDPSEARSVLAFHRLVLMLWPCVQVFRDVKLPRAYLQLMPIMCTRQPADGAVFTTSTVPAHCSVPLVRTDVV